ncbi:MAG: hypothetical protein LBC35_01305 [Coriobacteriales bacterium]|jgi:hypothetical protein|nr:hypothetical protein [Coriobacteriales bacterium]
MNGDTRLLPSRTAGQATVEYLIVGLALIALIAAIGLLAGRLGEGLFVEHAADSASHAITTNTAGSIGDVLLY